jgi:UDP-3-O-[3-hydroxymyristoyl] glucosamine N-acyltransferase
MVQAQLTGIQQPSYISATAKIGNMFVGAFTYIGDNSVIGDNVKLYPGVYVGMMLPLTIIRYYTRCKDLLWL